MLTGVSRKICESAQAKDFLLHGSAEKRVIVQTCSSFSSIDFLYLSIFICATYHFVVYFFNINPKFPFLETPCIWVALILNN